jgi:hypothetical protein
VTAYDLVCQRLLEVTGHPVRNGSALCPAHDDHNPSLSVNQGTEGVVLHCFAGCATPDVVAALKLTMADLFDKPRSTGRHRRILRTHPYGDEDGTLLYETVRFDGTGNDRFRQRRPDGKGGWIWNIEDTRKVLYQLPLVLEAIEAGGPILLSEGEHDADALTRAGAIATTNPLGAANWYPEYTQVLAGTRVAIYIDADDTGRKRGRTLVPELEAAGCTIVGVYEPVKGKDAAEVLGMGYDLDTGFRAADLDPLEVTVVTLDEFTAIDEPGAQPLLGEGDDALIPANGDVMFYGDGAGKTTLTIDLTCHLAASDTWLGITVPRPLTVLIVENEGPRPLFRKKLTRKRNAWVGSPINGRVRIVEDPWATLSFADDAHRDALAKAIAEHGCDVVLIGPVSKSGMTDAGTLAEVRGFTTLVADVRHRAGRPVTFVLVHHENRAGTPSGAWEGAVDTLLHVTGMGHGRTRLHVQKARWSPTWHARTLELHWTDGESYEVDEKPEITDDDIAEQILAAISENPGTGWTRVEEATPGIARQRRRAIRDRLFTDGVIVNVVKQDGREVALDYCAQGGRTRLYLASDPTIYQLRPDPGEAGAKPSPPTDGAPTTTSPLRPDSKEGEGRGEVVGGPSGPSTNGLGSCPQCGRRNVFGPCPQHSSDKP